MSTALLVDEGGVNWPDGTEFVNVTNPCCGSPYPVALMPDRAEYCAGCAESIDPVIDAERALDDDADMYFYDRD